MLLERVAETILRYNMLPAGCRLGVAVSGGADSVFLLYALRELSARWPVELAVLHLNHGLRGAASDMDARFVEELANGLGLAVRIEAASLGPGNIEEAGRQARLDFFRRAVREGFADHIGTGHTRNDQAETVIYRLIRGSGLAGLAGVYPVTVLEDSDARLLRPLIDCTRMEIEEFLTERGITWREDSTNTDRSFIRNRIRHELMPALAEYNPAVSEVLSQTARLARDEEEYWSGEMDRLALLFKVIPDGIILETKHLWSLPRAVSRRLLRRAFETVKGDLRSLGAAHTEAVLGLALEDENVHDRLQIPGLDIFRSFGMLKIGRPRTGPRESRDYEFGMPVPGVVAIPGAGIEIRTELSEGPQNAACGYTEDKGVLDADLAGGPLTIRNWRPGDRYARPGASEEKIKVLFQELRVPIWERQSWPVIISGGRIVWARRFGPAANAAPGRGTRRFLRILEARVI